MTVNISTYKLPDSIANKVVKAAVAMIAQTLEEVDCDGDFLATAKGRFPGHARGFRFVRYDNGQIICKVQPLGNDTAWEWWVTPPTGADGDRIAARLRGEDPEDLSAAVPDDFDPDKVAAALSGAQPTPEPAPAPPSEEFHAPTAGTIAERYELATKKAGPYQAKLTGLATIQQRIKNAYTEIEQLEAQLKIQEQELAKDTEGKKAYEALEQIKTLLGVED